MSRLTKEQVNEFAMKNDVMLSTEELDFVYDFAQKNWRHILSCHGNVDISRYKEKFSEENFVKIQKLMKEYSSKYGNYL